MSDVLKATDAESFEVVAARQADVDPAETQEWLDSLQYVLNSKGPERAAYLLSLLDARARTEGVDLPVKSNTPYINTIPVEKQAAYPGNREVERRIKSTVRWNAMAMVARGNRDFEGIGGHISTFGSSATLYEVAYNHFFRGRGESGYDGDLVYFQGHSSPGIYARAYLEGRLTEQHLIHFRRELREHPGLSSYPHPWLMPEFWEYPTVSMGLGPIMAIYQARFNEYLRNRGIKDTSRQRVWAFLGDGECDEPESLGAITLASREHLGNLTFVINCNLQRLDGPVRGNGKIIQELEANFRGAGWNVIKVVWGDDWDALLERDETGLLVKRMGEVVDGQYQKYVAMPGAYIREHFFGKYPELLELVKNYSDERLEKLRRGGHDPEKVYAAFKAATECTDRPSVILAKTIKGYGMGEGRNTAHNKKKAEEQELLDFRNRFHIPLDDDDVKQLKFYRFPEGSVELNYLRERRKTLGGDMPARPTRAVTVEVPRYDEYKALIDRDNGKEISTTSGFVRLLGRLCKDKKIGPNIVPIVPDESRTFGMEGMFREVGIYANTGQLYEPVDSDQLAYYKEARDGQLLEEGISEAGGMSSFNAAGSAYAAHGVNMIPFYIFYSMFGFQRIGDLVWAGSDLRVKGFMLGATAGRTTLNGEGLQHQDGHSLLNAIAFPTVRSFDPAFHYETATIIFDGLKRMYEDNETAIYYIMLGNENYTMPEMPKGAAEGIIRGMYRFRSRDVKGSAPRVQLFGSGAIMNCVLRGQELLADKFGIASDVWSVTSYTQLRRDAHEARRHNLLNPDAKPQQSWIEKTLAGVQGPFIAATDYVRALPEQVAPFLPGPLFALGTDGMGRSETRDALRRHFEVDGEFVALAAMYQLAQLGQLDNRMVATAVKQLGIDPAKADPLFA